MNIFVLLYNSGTDKEGIHSIELKEGQLFLCLKIRMMQQDIVVY